FDFRRRLDHTRGWPYRRPNVSKGAIMHRTPIRSWSALLREAVQLPRQRPLRCVRDVVRGEWRAGSRWPARATGRSDMASPTSATTFAGTITFTGGTGRFTNASGTAQFEFVLTATGGTLTFEGTIQY